MCICIDVNLDGRGGFAAARPSIVKKKLVALLLEIEATQLLNFSCGKYTALYQFQS